MTNSPLRPGSDSPELVPGRSYDGVILYGPPASGKDTITATLEELDESYAYFHRLKVGEGRTAGYRLTDMQALNSLRDQGLILYETARYEATYAIDRPELDRLIEGGLTPILHMGQLAGLDALHSYPCRWLDVLLWCPRDETEQRLRGRGSEDVSRRLAAWEETLAELHAAGPEPRFTLSLRTDGISPCHAAAAINALVRGHAQ